MLKVHHALADGMGARRIASVLLWDEDDPPAATTVPPAPDVGPTARCAGA